MLLERYRNRKFTDHEKLMIRAGIAEGERRLEHRLRLLQATNHRLWDELCGLDGVEPLVDVRMSPKEANMIVEAMKRGDATKKGPGAQSRRRVSKWLKGKIEEAVKIKIEILELAKGD